MYRLGKTLTAPPTVLKSKHISPLLRRVMMSALLLLGGASGFVLPTQPGRCRPGTAAAAAAVSNGKRPSFTHERCRTRAGLRRVPVHMGLFGLWATRSLHRHRADRHSIILQGPERLVPWRKTSVAPVSGGHRASDALKRAKTAVKYLTVKYPPQTYFTTRCFISVLSNFYLSFGDRFGHTVRPGL